MNPTISRSPDENASGFLSEPPGAHRYDYIDDDPDEAAALIAGFVPERARVLDVGCGSGVRWELLRGRFNYEKYGIMDATHLRWFTANSLINWLRNNGLLVQEMTHSAGTALPAYERVWPWRSLHEYRRAKLIRKLAKRWPLLFGCQHIVLASLPGA